MIYTFKILKMSCGGCVNTIKTTLMKLDDEAVIEVDLPTKQVTITTDLPVDTLKSALTQVGYPASELK